MGLGPRRALPLNVEQHVQTMLGARVDEALDAQPVGLVGEETLWFTTFARLRVGSASTSRSGLPPSTCSCQVAPVSSNSSERAFTPRRALARLKRSPVDVQPGQRGWRKQSSA